ncbi:MAG: 16S rRNA methyltransferase [Thermoplasmataceae archaeon]
MVCVLTIVIADAELETVPIEMREDYSIQKISRERKKRPENMILDSNFMHASIERYFPGESRRRGRPDIIHILMLVALESILNKIGSLRIMIHTRNNLIIDVSPETRIPRAYNRFIGLFEKLFSERKIVADGKALLSIRDGTVHDALGKSAQHVVVLAPGGEISSVSEVVREPGDLVVVIGGFSEGNYKSDLGQYGRRTIFREELTIWSVAMEVITEYERKNDFMKGYSLDRLPRGSREI